MWLGCCWGNYIIMEWLLTRRRPFKANSSTPPHVFSGKKLSGSRVTTTALPVFDLYSSAAFGSKFWIKAWSAWRLLIVVFGSMIWYKPWTINVDKISVYRVGSLVTSPKRRRASSNTLRTWSSRTFRTYWHWRTKRAQRISHRYYIFTDYWRPLWHYEH